MIELTTAFEIAKNFPSGIGGFFGSIVGGETSKKYSTCTLNGKRNYK